MITDNQNDAVTSQVAFFETTLETKQESGYV